MEQEGHSRHRDSVLALPNTSNNSWSQIAALLHLGLLLEFFAETQAALETGKTTGSGTFQRLARPYEYGCHWTFCYLCVKTVGPQKQVRSNIIFLLWSFVPSKCGMITALHLV